MMVIKVFNLNNNFEGALANLQQLASAGNCDFYNELERIKNCGQTGYLIAYGGKYCRKFISL